MKTQITSLAQLYDAAMQRRAVTTGGWYGIDRVPAAFVISMQALMVHRLIQKGLFLYERTTPKRKLKHVKDCQIGNNWEDCPACVDERKEHIQGSMKP